jgi:hypothetical protein
MLRHIKNDNGTEVIQNFDWDITKRELCIFMPNYHDAKYTKFSLRQIRTEMPKDNYVVIVGNDNTDDNFEEFEDENVFFFSLKRPTKQSRNGCFIRNYVIKRCQSRRFFQKDGEVVIIGDFIKNCIQWDTPWRAGVIYVLDEGQTDQYMNTGKTDSFINKPTHRVQKIFPGTVDEAKKMIFQSKGCLNLSTYHHYAYCVDTVVIKGINGYDEDYKHYGFEDSDMFCRLYAMNHRIIPDPSCFAVHLCHPRNIIQGNVNDMGAIFQRKSPHDGVRNPNGWGEGI